MVLTSIQTSKSMLTLTYVTNTTLTTVLVIESLYKRRRDQAPHGVVYLHGMQMGVVAQDTGAMASGVTSRAR